MCNGAARCTLTIVCESECVYVYCSTIKVKMTDAVDSFTRFPNVMFDLVHNTAVCIILKTKMRNRTESKLSNDLFYLFWKFICDEQVLITWKWKKNTTNVKNSYSFGLLIVNFATVTSNECVHIEFTFATLIVHETNFPENCSFAPTLVVHTTNRPHATWCESKTL